MILHLERDVTPHAVVFAPVAAAKSVGLRDVSGSEYLVDSAPFVLQRRLEFA